MKTANEIFDHIKVNAKNKWCVHVGLITERRLQEVERQIARYKKLADMDKKLGVIDENKYNDEMEVLKYMLMSLKTAVLY